MSAERREITVARPNAQKIQTTTAVNLLAHVKSLRINAHARLAIDTRAQIAETFHTDMAVIVSHV
jgi:hypothetical protein